MQVRIDPSICQGHAVCHLTAPDVFLVDDDDDGRAHVASPDVPAELESQVRLAAENCPERAIFLSSHR
jgi:ferredoxin